MVDKVKTSAKTEAPKRKIRRPKGDFAAIDDVRSKARGEGYALGYEEGAAWVRTNRYALTKKIEQLQTTIDMARGQKTKPVARLYKDMRSICELVQAANDYIQHMEETHGRYLPSREVLDRANNAGNELQHKYAGLLRGNKQIITRLNELSYQEKTDEDSKKEVSSGETKTSTEKKTPECPF